MIHARIHELNDWRGRILAHVPALMREADLEVVEEWKWRGVSVGSDNGLICTGQSYKRIAKLTFAKGASVADPTGMFNVSLAGNTRQAIDLHEGDDFDASAFRALTRNAVALTISSRRWPNAAGRQYVGRFTLLAASGRASRVHAVPAAAPCRSGCAATPRRNRPISAA
ncbi:MAG: DUF1801 domain-containing protein [Rhodopila sp.]